MTHLVFEHEELVSCHLLAVLCEDIKNVELEFHYLLYIARACMNRITAVLLDYV